MFKLNRIDMIVILITERGLSNNNLEINQKIFSITFKA